MGKVILDIAMSVDGFIAGANDEDCGLHNYFFAPSDATAKVIEEGIATTGAIVMGKRTYDVGDAQDGFAETPYKITHFVLAHQVPEKPTKGDTKFVFVTDGIESIIQQAKSAAGEKDVAVGGGGDIARQCLKAGLVDEIQIHLIPVLLGKGKRLFEHLGIEPLNLESIRVIESSNVTHLQFRVVK